MACSACSSPTIVCSVPETYREFAPAESSVATLCTRCLTVESAASEATDGDADPDFSRVSDAFPSDHETAVALALAVDLCSSLATNRAAIETLLEAVERVGTDPLLAIDRLASDPDLEPAIDLDRRRHQLEQLLY